MKDTYRTEFSLTMNFAVVYRHLKYVTCSYSAEGRVVKDMGGHRPKVRGQKINSPLLIISVYNLVFCFII